jgi:hypothetical protein
VIASVMAAEAAKIDKIAVNAFMASLPLPDCFPLRASTVLRDEIPRNATFPFYKPRAGAKKFKLKISRNARETPRCALAAFAISRI